MSFEKLFTEISPTINSTIKLSKKEKQYKKISYIAFGSMVIFLFSVGIIIPKIGGGLYVLFMFIFFFAPFIVGIVFQSKAYFLQIKRKTCSENIVKKIITFVQPNLYYSKKNFIPWKIFCESEIFTSKKDINKISNQLYYYGEDYITGKHNNVDFEVSEIYYQSNQHAKKWYMFIIPFYAHTYMMYRHIFKRFVKKTRFDFKGLFFVADFHKKFKGKTIIVPDFLEKRMGYLAKKVQEANFKRDELVYLENPKFEKEFVVYSDDQVTARYILSPSFMEKIMALKEKANNTVYFSFKDSKIHVGISSIRDLFDFTYKKNQDSKQQLKVIVNDINFCLEIIDELKLNNNIWKTN